MLILSRKIGEAVRMGSGSVKLLSVHGNQVRLGFEAPPEIAIVRAELCDRITDAIDAPSVTAATSAALIAGYREPG